MRPSSLGDIDSRVFRTRICAPENTPYPGFVRYTTEVANKGEEPRDLSMGSIGVCLFRRVVSRITRSRRFFGTPCYHDPNIIRAMHLLWKIVLCVQTDLQDRQGEHFEILSCKVWLYLCLLTVVRYLLLGNMHIRHKQYIAMRWHVHHS